MTSGQKRNIFSIRVTDGSATYSVSQQLIEVQAIHTQPFGYNHH